MFAHRTVCRVLPPNQSSSPTGSPQLIMLFKTNDCLRHLDRALGTPFNTAILIVMTCNDAILKEELRIAKSWKDCAKAWWRYLHLYYRVGTFVIVQAIRNFWRTLFSWHSRLIPT